VGRNRIGRILYMGDIDILGKKKEGRRETIM
jgi:hypothetical protein